MIFSENTEYFLDFISDSTNVQVMYGFLTDKMFYQMIKECDFVLFPYTRDTNNGIRLPGIWCWSFALISKIQWFTENELLKFLFSLKVETLLIWQKEKWKYQRGNFKNV